MIVRKEREYVRFVACIIAQWIVWQLMGVTGGVALVALMLVSIFVTYETIQALSTYMIIRFESRTRTLIIMCIGCAFGIIGGAGAYLLLRQNELKGVKVCVKLLQSI